jgi:uncharacterized protein YggE
LEVQNKLKLTKADYYDSLPLIFEGLVFLRKDLYLCKHHKTTTMEKRTIVITGTSTLNVKTDYINIRFHIDKLDISYKKSLSLLTEQVSKITDILYKEGFSKEDLKTSDFNIRKDTRYDDKKKQYVFLGYRVTETLTLSFPIDNQKK